MVLLLQYRKHCTYLSVHACDNWTVICCQQTATAAMARRAAMAAGRRSWTGSWCEWARAAGTSSALRVRRAASHCPSRATTATMDCTAKTITTGKHRRGRIWSTFICLRVVYIYKLSYKTCLYANICLQSNMYISSRINDDCVCVCMRVYKCLNIPELEIPRLTPRCGSRREVVYSGQCSVRNEYL